MVHFNLQIMGFVVVCIISLATSAMYDIASTEIIRTRVSVNWFIVRVLYLK